MSDLPPEDNVLEFAAMPPKSVQESSRVLELTEPEAQYLAFILFAERTASGNPNVINAVHANVHASLQLKVRGLVKL